MSEKILFVDDDQKILNGIERQFEDTLDFQTANHPAEALEVLKDNSPFAVVVTDMRMPGMNGVELLSQVRELSPDTVRIMLTGYADLQVTIEAVNEGNIFRFLSKPCPPDVLEKAVRDGLTQYRLVTAEHELLEGTLHGSIKVLSEMLSLVNPLAFGRTSQVQRIAVAIGEDLKLPNLWDVRIAAMLFPLGCVTVSQTTLESVLAGQSLGEQEQRVFSQHASIACNMLGQIPRLETVAAIVAYQDKCFDGSGNPDDDVSGDEIPIGARILKLASDFEILYKLHGDTAQALQKLKERTGYYDPNVVESLRNALRIGLCQSSRREVSVHEIKEGMVLAADVRAKRGQLLATSGQEVTDSIRRRLCDLHNRDVFEGDLQIEILGEVDSSELATV
ncbi:HD domain-containing phosphohydrolase [Planctomycetota bacterium]